MKTPDIPRRPRFAVLAAVATAFLVRAAAAGPAPATASSEASAPVARAVEEGVTARIARNWNVDPAVLRLKWGRAPSGAKAPDAALVRITGQGRDGWMAAVVASPDGAPAAVPVRAGRLDTVWTAARTLAAGSRLAEGDAQPETRVLWGPPRGGARERPAPGWEVRRNLALGEMLIEPAVEPPALIDPGEAVQLIWSRGTVRLSLTGRALNRARSGEAVRVRIPGRERPLTATAVEAGVAEIDPGGSR